MAAHRAVKESGAISILFSAEARKFQTVVIGVLLAAASQGLLPPEISVWVLLIVGVLTATGVYVVPNSGKDVVVATVDTPEVEAPFAGDVKG